MFYYYFDFLGSFFMKFFLIKKGDDRNEIFIFFLFYFIENLILFDFN